MNKYNAFDSFVYLGSLSLVLEFTQEQISHIYAEGLTILNTQFFKQQCKYNNLGL